MSMLVDEGGGSAETGEMGEGTSGGGGGAAAKTTTTGGRARQSDRGDVARTGDRSGIEIETGEDWEGRISGRARNGNG